MSDVATDTDQEDSDDEENEYEVSDTKTVPKKTTDFKFVLIFVVAIISVLLGLFVSS